MTAASLPRRSVEEEARLEQALVELFEQRITFNQTLGLNIAAARPGAVLGRFAMRPHLVGHYAYGRLHGGVISAVLDAVGALALMVGIAERHPHDDTAQVMHRFARMATIDLRVDFLRQGLGEHFDATAEVTRLGGRVGSTQMRLVNHEGTLIATAAAAYTVA
ncbi:Thioesterase family protein [Rubrivivax sp. A210]|uniref:thioesterase family protein n=1 Tax=Rubrivivax sp. A210 TaxID=2772301 RepID=UPI00191A4B49|nr:thioesterase family protein [Rubrivivax sp. A210]CAD5369868.1 Thioesterase family protein [Rubrivivax sp. A210]